jgi:hypothetical protein
VQRRIAKRGKDRNCHSGVYLILRQDLLQSVRLLLRLRSGILTANTKKLSGAAITNAATAGKRFRAALDRGTASGYILASGKQAAGDKEHGYHKHQRNGEAPLQYEKAGS